MIIFSCGSDNRREDTVTQTLVTESDIAPITSPAGTLAGVVASVHPSAAAPEVMEKAWYQPLMDVLQRFFDSLKKIFNAFTITECHPPALNNHELKNFGAERKRSQEALRNKLDDYLSDSLLEIGSEGLLNYQDAKYLSMLRYPDRLYAGQYHSLTLILNRRIADLPLEKQTTICRAITCLAEAVNKETHLVEKKTIERFLAEELLYRLLKTCAHSIKAALAAGWPVCTDRMETRSA